MGAPSLPDDLKKALRAPFCYDQPVGSNALSIKQSLAGEKGSGVSWTQVKYTAKMTSFQLCVNLQAELANLESEDGSGSEFERRTAALLTSEYLIYDLNRHTPLQYNPFLSHWVLTACSLQGYLRTTSEKGLQKTTYCRIRLSLLQAILLAIHEEIPLQTVDGRTFADLSPRSIVNSTTAPTMLDLKPFIGRMRVQGAYIPSSLLANTLPMNSGSLISASKANQPSNDQNWPAEHSIVNIAKVPSVHDATLSDVRRRATEMPSYAQAHVTKQDRYQDPPTFNGRILDTSWEDAGLVPNSRPRSQNKGKMPVHSAPPITSHSNPEDIRSALKVDHESTIQALKRFPLGLQALDLLTRLLESDILTTAGVDTAWFVLEYVQHCLRLIDHLGTSRSPASDSEEPYNYHVAAGVPSGREEQARAVKLLVLFMKNLLQKGLLPVQELAYDLQEIDVRYMWVPEVRDFGNLLEGNALLDDEMATAPDSSFGVGG